MVVMVVMVISRGAAGGEFRAQSVRQRLRRDALGIKPTPEQQHQGSAQQGEDGNHPNEIKRVHSQALTT
jgi:hypothetical protein